MALAADSSPVPLDLVRAFKDAGLAHGVDINISGTPEEPLFQANQVGALLGITNIRDTIKDFDDDEKGVGTTDTLGGRQAALFLTELGLYRLLGMSRKPLARPFQKWVAQVIKEIRLRGRYDLQQKLEEQASLVSRKEDELTSLKAAQRLKVREARHEALMTEHTQQASGGVVYVFHVQDACDDSFVIKVGQCMSLATRHPQLQSHFGVRMHLMDVFECWTPQRLESMIKTHPMFTACQFNFPKVRGPPSTETYMVQNNASYDVLRQTMRDVHAMCKAAMDRERRDAEISLRMAEIPLRMAEIELRMAEIALRKAELETDRASMFVKLMEDPKRLVVMNAFISATNMAARQGALQEPAKPCPTPPVPSAPAVPEQLVTHPRPMHVRYTVGRGPKVQRYSRDGRTFVACFVGICAAMRAVPNTSSTGIRAASANRTLYRGFRWHLIDDRSRDENEPVDIGPTVNEDATNRNAIESVCVYKINPVSNKVIEVFSTAKEAGQKCGVVIAAIVSALQKPSRKSAGHLWRRETGLTAAQRQQVRDDNLVPDEPTQSRAGARAKKVRRIDPATGDLVKEYLSMSDVCIELRVARATLKTAISDRRMMLGSIWEL